MICDCHTWIIIIIIILFFWEFFTPVLADGFSLESDSKSLQVSRTLLSILANLNNAAAGLHSSSYSQVFQSLYLAFGDCTKLTNYNWYHCHFHFSSKVLVLISIFTFFQFYPVVSWKNKVHYLAGSLFFWWPSLGLIVWLRLCDTFLSQNSREFCTPHFIGLTLDSAYTICSHGQRVKFKLLAQFLVDHLPHSVMFSLILFLH